MGTGCAQSIGDIDRTQPDLVSKEHFKDSQWFLRETVVDVPVGAALTVAERVNETVKPYRTRTSAEREVRKLPNVLECHLVSGEFDYLIKARIPEMNAYRRLLGECYRAAVAMEGRVGMTISPTRETWEREHALLEGLGRVPVLARYYAHETAREW